MKIKSFFFQYLPVIISAIILTVCLAYAWTPPSSPPPSGNVSPPINTGNTPQSKEGDLNIGKGLKYWITKLGDSFALKNNSGQIKFVLGQDGNVGIGKNDPQTKLDVNGKIYANNPPAIGYGSVVAKGAMTAVYGNTSHYGFFEGRRSDNKRGFYLGYGNGNDLVTLWLDSANKLNIGGGNVGIGTTNPQAKLHVNGRIKAQDPIDNNDVATKAYVDAQVGASIPLVRFTKATYTGNLGGVAGADAKCQAEFGPSFHFCDCDKALGAMPGAALTSGWCKGCGINCNGWTTNNSGVSGGIIYGSTGSGIWRERCTSGGGGWIGETESINTCSSFKRLICCNW